MMAAPTLILRCSYFLPQTAYKYLRRLQVGDLLLIVTIDQSCIWIRMPARRCPDERQAIEPSFVDKADDDGLGGSVRNTWFGHGPIVT
jgi:hypothetical protein